MLACLVFLWISFAGAIISSSSFDSSSVNSQPVSTADLVHTLRYHSVKSSSHTRLDTHDRSEISTRVMMKSVMIEPQGYSKKVTRDEQIRPTSSSGYSANLDRIGTTMSVSGSDSRVKETLTEDPANASTVDGKEDVLQSVHLRYIDGQKSVNDQISFDHILSVNSTVNPDVTSHNQGANHSKSYVNEDFSNTTESASLLEVLQATMVSELDNDVFFMSNDIHSPYTFQSDLISTSGLKLSSSFSQSFASESEQVSNSNSILSSSFSQSFAFESEQVSTSGLILSSSFSQSFALESEQVPSSGVILSSPFVSSYTFVTEQVDTLSKSLQNDDNRTSTQSDTNTILINATSLPNNMTSDIGDATSVSVETPMCRCDCHYAANLKLYRNATAVNITSDEVQKELKKQVTSLQKALSINKTNLSSAKRKKTSMNDDRASARGVGLIGVFMLVLLMGGLVLMDLTTIKRDFQRLKDNLGHCCKEKQSVC